MVQLLSSYLTTVTSHLSDPPGTTGRRKLYAFQLPVRMCLSVPLIPSFSLALLAVQIGRTKVGAVGHFHKWRQLYHIKAFLSDIVCQLILFYWYVIQIWQIWNDIKLIQQIGNISLHVLILELNLELKLYAWFLIVSYFFYHFLIRNNWVLKEHLWFHIMIEPLLTFPSFH